MTPEDQFISDFAQMFGSLPPQTVIILKDLLSKLLVAPYQDLLNIIEGERANVKRSRLATDMIDRLSAQIRAQLPTQEDTPDAAQ